jgi:hypothetical protein
MATAATTPLRTSVINFLKDLDANNNKHLKEAWEEFKDMEVAYNAVKTDNDPDTKKTEAEAFMNALADRFDAWRADHQTVKAPVLPKTFENVPLPLEKDGWVEEIKKHNGVKEKVIDFNTKRYRHEFKNKVDVDVRASRCGPSSAAEKFVRKVKQFEKAIEGAIDSEYDLYDALDKKTPEKAQKKLVEAREDNRDVDYA